MLMWCESFESRLPRIQLGPAFLNDEFSSVPGLQLTIRQCRSSVRDHDSSAIAGCNVFALHSREIGIFMCTVNTVHVSTDIAPKPNG
ncbi:hypothetical protein TNCV_4647431 [Trichonephila clavipes]|uniref:Uncharacterized protein n=1 Tax=Trichonephila clavipes TaxID=2585209 RepID=A0A8X6SU92_TRICX|nr:hypothetical protein TNCV_4647431 [Trichonephila clavipes]